MVNVESFDAIEVMAKGVRFNYCLYLERCECYSLSVRNDKSLGFVVCVIK